MVLCLAILRCRRRRIEIWDLLQKPAIPGNLIGIHHRLMCIGAAGRISKRRTILGALSPTYALSLAAFTFFGEVLLGLWLSWRGIKGFEQTPIQQEHGPVLSASDGAPS